MRFSVRTIPKTTITCCTAVIGCLALGLTAYSVSLQSQVFDEMASTVTDLQTVQHETAVAGLNFRRAIDGDEPIDLDGGVWQRLAATAAMVNRSRARQLSDLRSAAASAAIHDDLLALEQKIGFYVDSLNTEWTNRLTGTTLGMPARGADAALQDILTLTMLVTEQVEGEIAATERRIATLNAAIVMMLIAMLIAVALLWLRDRRSGARPGRPAHDGFQGGPRLSKDGALEETLANLGHEMRTSIHGIVSTAGVLIDDELSHEQRQLVAAIKASGNALLALSSEVLDYAPGDTPSPKSRNEAVDVERLLEQLVLLFSADALAKGLSLKHRIAPDVPAHVGADGVGLYQVLSNLMSNAIKFSERGAISVTCELVRSSSSSDAGSMLKFVVRDSGIGIDARDRQRVFRRYSRLGRRLAPRESGTGLGLAICRDLVEQMGGTIGVRSEFGSGSEFWFTVAVDATRAHRRIEPVTAGEPRILIADDHATSRLIAKSMLHKLGFSADCAVDGNEAIAAASRHSYAAILIDNQMPHVSGNDAIRAIRAAESGAGHTPIIALTAGAMPSARDGAFEAGADEYLAKPVSLTGLQAALERLLRCMPASRYRQRSLGQIGQSNANVFDSRIVAELCAITGSSKTDLFTRLAQQFVEATPASLSALESAVSADSKDCLRRQAHRLLGACSQIGAERMARICRKLTTTDDSADPRRLHQSIVLLKAEFDAACREIDPR